jgi:hypothetical protein
MADHAFLAPSSAARWVVCALSASLEAAYPEREPSPESLEGTAAHWVVQECLYRRPPAIGTQTPNGIAVDAVMLESAEMVVDDITATLGPNWPSILIVEQRVNIPRVHDQNWGTPDYRAWSRLGDGRLKLHVWDYKYGHEPVDVFENWQLIDYVAGCLSEAKIVDDQNTVVDMRVIQPRSHHREGPVRSWHVLASDLRGQINRLAMAAEDATSIAPTAKPHRDACKNCKGRHACEANQRAAYWAADAGKHYTALELPPAALGLELRTLTDAAKILAARISGLEAEALANITAGRHVPHWQTERELGRLTWTHEGGEVIAFAQMMGVDITKPVEPVTPTQAKTKFKAAKLPENLVDMYATRNLSAPKLALDDGKKARLTFSSSGAEFKFSLTK